MKRLNLTQAVNPFALVLAAIALAASLTAAAQTAPPPPVKKVVTPPVATKKAAPATPAAKPATPTPTAKPATLTTNASQKAQSPASVVTPASSQTVLTPSTSGYTSAPSSPLNALTSAGTSGNRPSPAGDPRAPVAGQGVGTFLWPGGWTLTAYGCFRTGTRLFCDFDTTNQNNLQANSNIWSGYGGVNLVDDGGKITQRHNAFFVGDDGSQFTTAYISPQPVRFIIEYDDVDPRYTSISLVLVNNRIQGVPITVIDPSQPAGTMPARASANPPASGTPGAVAGANGVLGKAAQAINAVNDQKNKAQGVVQSVQGAVQSH